MSTVRSATVTAAFALAALGSSSALATPPVHSPWPCGVEESVTQDHNTANSHGPTTRDAWAWDLGIGVGESVVAPYDGVVRSVVVGPEVSCKSCDYCDEEVEGDCDNCGCWTETNHVVITFDDGTEAQLMHLRRDSSTLKVGDVVRRGQVVGAVGLSGQITGAHLHFHVQSNDDCSSQPWYCSSIPASFVDVGDPAYNLTYTSRNCELEASCIVRGSESLMIDDSSSCFIDAAGTETWERYDEPSDSYSFRYVPNTNGTEATAEGYWRFRVEETGLYRVEVQMPWWDARPGSVSATYEVGSGAVRTEVGPIDQLSNSANWVTLGESFLLREETESYVRLGNSTVEASGSTLIGFDQVRITRVDDYVPSRCAVVDGVEITEDGECFSTSGDSWFELDGGRDGFRYSNSNNLARPLEVGTWELEVASAEPHEIWVYLPDEAEAARARYQLFNGYITLDLDPVDQSSGPGWVKLTRDGEDSFELYAGLPARLSLGDNTGEPFIEGGGDQNTIVAFDSIAVAPASLGFDPDSLGDKADANQEGGGGSRGSQDEGCACAADGGTGPGGMALALLGLWALRRRRTSAA